MSRNRLHQTLLAEIADSRLDLEGDVGAVGRFSINEEDGLCCVDIKGQQYMGPSLNCATLMVVKFSQDEARVESVTHQFLQMKPSRDVISEMGGVVTEGSMGGDFFDSFYEQDANAERASHNSDDDLEKNNSNAVKGGKLPSGKAKGSSKKRQAPASSRKGKGSAGKKQKK